MKKTAPPTSLQSEQNFRSKRIVALDVLKCFAIYLVLWAHGIQHLTTADCVENPVYRWIYSFHMPLFMMVSGFFSGKSMKLTFGKFVRKKLKQIALPGFVWPWIFTLICIVFMGESLHLSRDFTQYIPYWFLWALLICNFWAYIGNKFKYGLLVTLLISQTIPFANVIYMYPAFVLGQAIGTHKDWFRNHIKKIIVISGVAYLILMQFWGADNWHLSSQTQEMIEKGGYVKAGIFYVGKTAFKILVNLSGSVMFFSLFFVLERLWNNVFGRFMGFVGKYTLIVYILQSFILESNMNKFVNLDNLSAPLFNYVATPAIALAVLLFSVAVAAIVDKNKYTRLLLLGR